MYLSIRDIAFAKGRFALIGGVVALITLLLVLLTGLTNGLGHQNTSALERLGAARIIFSAPADDSEPSFTESAVTGTELRTWEEAVGASAVERLGVTQTRAESDASAASVAVLSLEDGTGLAPDLQPVEGRTHPAAGQVVLSAEAASDLSATLGDTVQLSSAELTVAGIVEDTHYSHLPVAWTAIADFPGIAHLGEEVEATVLAIPAETAIQTRAAAAEAGSPGEAAGAPGEGTFAGVDTAAQTVSTDTRGAFAALPAYQSERGSLLMMQAFLYGISALVVVSFLTVWTIQRTRDLAVLRALGSSRAYLVRDSLIQAAVVVLLGAAAGGLLGVAGGAVVQAAVPFQLTPVTVIAPVLGVFALGLAGAVIATRRVSAVDPLLALGGN